MNCDEFKEILIIRIYGTLPADKEEALRQHANDCSVCAEAFARTQKFANFLNPDDSCPEPDWQKSWRVIRERSKNRAWQWPGWMGLRPKRFAMAAATVVVVFVLGVFAGRSIFVTQPKTTPLSTSRGYQSIASVSAYAQAVEPLLIDFMNHGGAPPPELLAELTDRVLADVLMRTHSLKRAAAKNGDEQLYSLLEDIELILISIANLSGQNGDIADQLIQTIRDKSIIRRLEQLPMSNTTT